MAFQSPQLGYNTNVRHHGELFHIQTEDSGARHPHVITHLFADGGRILASRKTSYADFVGSETCDEHVKQLMRAQHKAMFIALRDGEFDDPSTSGDSAIEDPDEIGRDVHPSPPSSVLVQPIRFCLGSPGTEPMEPEGAQGRGLYQPTRPASRVSERPSLPPAGTRPASEIPPPDEHMDEVVLSYLASEPPPDPED